MTYQYFAFLDVLGYKELLMQDILSNKLDFKDKLVASFQALETLNIAEFRYKSISDSIMLSCDQSKNFLEFLSVIKKLYFEFLKNGLFLRGGISFDKHFENSTILYSMALTKAYELESSKAIYPRIIIDENILGVLENKGELDALKSSNLVIKDGNINQLQILDNTNWEQCFKFAESIYFSSKDAVDKNTSIRQKQVWFQNYLFHFYPSNSNCEKYIQEWTKL